MRRSLFVRVLAVALVVCMCVTPVSAAGWGSSRSSGWGSIWGSWWGNWWGSGWGSGSTTPTTPTTPTDPTESTEPVQTEDNSGTMVVVEDAETVDNGELLRANTFALTRDTSEGAETTVKYFPVTMYDYDNRINNATKLKDTASNKWEGLYFSGGSPAGTTETDLSNFVAGQYHIQNIRAAANNVNSWISYHVSEGIKMIRAESKEDATLWTLEVEDGKYYLSTTVDGTKLYLTMVGTGADGDTFTEEKTEITISAFSGNSTGVQLSRNEDYLCQWGSETETYYGGWTNNDGGNGMRFYAVDADGNVSDIPTTLGGINVHTELTWAQVQAGTYYADGACTQRVTVNTIGESGSGYTRTTVYVRDIWNSKGNEVTVRDVNTFETNYYYYYANKYYPVYIRNDGAIYYVQFCYTDYYNYLYGVGANWGSMFGIDDEVTLYTNSLTVTGYTLTAGGETLATLNGTDTSAQVGVTLYTPGTVTSVTKLYAEWNHWNKGSGKKENGDLIWTGLAQNTLVDDKIVFNVPDGGIFDKDADVKDIYEYIGMPFVFENGYYHFDSDVNGVYFENGVAASGTADELNNLVFEEGEPQPMPQGTSVGDHSTNAWLPFNGKANTTQWNENLGYYEGTYSKNINYHFGMRADIPFAMTANGRVKSTDDSSEPIRFTFSGDDDVWVYVDGMLVIDLGGIHNRLDVTIDFAANTVTYSEENGQDTDYATGSYNDNTFQMTQKLFTDENGKGLIDMTRQAFSVDEDHNMQFFYLERGEGTSNCQITFNLPMNDTVLVTKDATQSWEEKTDTVSNLTASEQKVIDNMNFGFTLYKKTADDTEFAAVTNTNFYLLDKDGKVLSINSTDANGRFYLKNGQTAKFITEIPADGVTYYVVEDAVPDGFVTPDYNFAGKAAYGFDCGDAHYTDASEIPEQVIDVDATVFNSKEVTVKGSVEANDSIQFICSNFMDATLPNPSAFTTEDIIVIDYGLPVQIDPLANDLFRGDELEILYIGGEGVTLETAEQDDGVVMGTIKDGGVVVNAFTQDEEVKDVNFGTVKMNKGTADAHDESRDTLVYTLNKQLTEVEVLTYVIRTNGKATTSGGSKLTQNAYAIGKVYIVPATQMYYEENFSDMVTFTGSNWQGQINTTGTNEYQEPGVVGTVDDSVYGSDVAYLNNSYDSNGTSYYGDTTKSAIRFTYSFTGTGTTFFARTSAKTGYMQIKVYEGIGTTGALVQQFYRDTYYEDTNNTGEDADGVLYNIPVYTQDGLEYGTYTVQVTVAKKGTITGVEGGSGNEFYLDGIRVMQPLNEHVESYDDNGDPVFDAITQKALGAYATDGEANMDYVTLRAKLLADNDPESEENWNFVVMTDTDGQIIKAGDYKNIGPKEEVYLMPGQSVSFAIKHWHKSGYMLNLGMKAPFGSGEAQVGQTTYDLSNTVDCYYKITDNYSSLVTETDEKGNTYYVATYTITANEKIVALTNLKVSGEYEFQLIEKVDIEVPGDDVIEEE